MSLLTSEVRYVVPVDLHNQLVAKAYKQRGYDDEEVADAVKFCESAAAHGIGTHNAIKGLQLDSHFGSVTGGCKPGAKIREIPSRYKAISIWDSNRKLGQSVANSAIKRCIELADQYGVGIVSVDNCFHYLWGGGYVMEAAQKGYIAYTNCTSMLAEVVPFKGKSPTIGTNPHSYAFPTVDAIGFPILIDWATSTISMGKVEQFKREGRPLPSDSALDSEGRPTTDPNQVAALIPFGEHKGYSLGLINELIAAFIGGSLPTLRGHNRDDNEKHSSSFFFQVIAPEAISGDSFAMGRSQKENIKAVILDILGHGNKDCLLPGQLEAEAKATSDRYGGLLFTESELDAFDEIARECNEPLWDRSEFKTL
jgi:ureidoglycolate dehydrogenase (NAD+)